VSILLETEQDRVLSSLFDNESLTALMWAVGKGLIWTRLRSGLGLWSRLWSGLWSGSGLGGFFFLSF
jgi:hypothetical protein